jgi:hypothetical protein
LSAIVVSLAIAAFYGLMLLGWGELFRRALGLARGRAAIDMALGIAAVVAVGGALNAARLAFPLALGVVALVGITVAFFRVARDVKHMNAADVRAWAGSKGPAAVVVIGAMAFVGATLVPPSMMNLGDDLRKYLAHVARMLQTGTLYGSPLNSLGTESPGGQPFLQSFIAAVAPFPYINAFDALFCFGLCMGMAASLAGLARHMAVIGALGSIAVVVIEPQSANISSTYSGSALALALYALLAAPEEIAGSPAGRRALAAGLIAAAMIALKPTFLLIAAVMIGAAAVSIAVSDKSLGAAIRWSVIAAGAALLGLLPWVAGYSPYLLAISSVALEGATALPSTQPVKLLSSAPLPWGASGLAYTLAMIFPFAAGALALLRWRHLSSEERTGAITLAVAGLGAFGGFIFVVVGLGSRFAENDTAVRYMTPVVIAVVPASIVLGARFFVAGLSKPAVFVRTSAYAALAIASLALFVPQLAQRAAQAAEFHNVLASRYLSIVPDYLSIYERLTGLEQAAFVRRLQDSAPPGAAILALVNAPFWFDFRRNPIYDATLAGIHAPWAHIPPVEYVIWDYGSAAVEFSNVLPDSAFPGVDRRAFGLVKVLIDATKTGGLIYNDGQFVVFRASGLPAIWPNYP